MQRENISYKSTKKKKRKKKIFKDKPISKGCVYKNYKTLVKEIKEHLQMKHSMSMGWKTQYIKVSVFLNLICSSSVFQSKFQQAIL